MQSARAQWRLSPPQRLFTFISVFFILLLSILFTVFVRFVILDIKIDKKHLLG